MRRLLPAFFFVVGLNSCKERVSVASSLSQTPDTPPSQFVCKKTSSMEHAYTISLKGLRKQDGLYDISFENDSEHIDNPIPETVILEAVSCKFDPEDVAVVKCIKKVSSSSGSSTTYGLLTKSISNRQFTLHNDHPASTSVYVRGWFDSIDIDDESLLDTVRKFLKFEGFQSCSRN